MSHYPNPFDFVPFPEAPILRTEEEFDGLGEKLSGYIELEIKALTPVHIVGKVEAHPDAHRSFMYRQNDRPCIPASSIRGCLRAFTEALTAGWVSQATPEYPKVYGRDRDPRPQRLPERAADRELRPTDDDCLHYIADALPRTSSCKVPDASGEKSPECGEHDPQWRRKASECLEHITTTEC